MTRIFMGLAAGATTLVVLAASLHAAFDHDPEKRASGVASASPVALGDTPRASPTPASGPGAASDSAADLDRLNPAEFVMTPANFGGHPSYGRAMLLSDCQALSKTRAELADPARLNALMASDPSGESLKRLSFEGKVREVQCAGLGERDFRQIPALMAEAARAGDPSARAWLLDDRMADLETRIGTATGDGAERKSLVAQARALLSDAAALAETGNLDAALVASRLQESDRYGIEDLVSSAGWMLVAAQVPGRSFNPKPELFRDEAYARLPPAAVKQAQLQARQVFARCCMRPLAENAGTPPSR